MQKKFINCLFVLYAFIFFSQIFCSTQKQVLNLSTDTIKLDLPDDCFVEPDADNNSDQAVTIKKTKQDSMWQGLFMGTTAVVGIALIAYWAYLYNGSQKTILTAFVVTMTGLKLYYGSYSDSPVTHINFNSIIKIEAKRKDYSVDLKIFTQNIYGESKNYELSGALFENKTMIALIDLIKKGSDYDIPVMWVS